MDKAVGQVTDSGSVHIVSVLEDWNLLLVAGGMDAGANANIASELHCRLEERTQAYMKGIAQQIICPII